MQTELHLAMTQLVHEKLKTWLLQNSPSEEMCFGLIYPSTGLNRKTLLLKDIIYPKQDERMVHGNITFSAKIINRAIDQAIDAKAGLALIHSHPSAKSYPLPSKDDLVAEARTLRTARFSIGEMPMAGLIMSGNGKICGREYLFEGPDSIPQIVKTTHTRIVGQHLFYEKNFPTTLTIFSDVHKSHIGMLGAPGQALLSELTVGIIGEGSVGSCVNEQLSRLGVGKIIAIDYDRIESKNRNRVYGSTREDVKAKLRKVTVAERQAKIAATADNFQFVPFVGSVVEKEPLPLLLDCDVIFSCADNHWSRHVLNSISYAHLIPVIDGGTRICADREFFQTASCRTETIGPSWGCLLCGGIIKPTEVSEEMIRGTIPNYVQTTTQLDEPSVISLNTVLAGLEVLRFKEIVLNIANTSHPRQRYDYRGGDIKLELTECKNACPVKKIECLGDTAILLLGKDPRFKDREISKVIQYS